MTVTFSEILQHARAYQGGDVEGVLLESLQQFASLAEDDLSLLDQAAAELPLLPVPGAAIVSLMLGAANERLEQAPRTAPAVWSLFMTWLEKLPASAELETLAGGNFQPSDEQAEILASLRLLCQAVVSHLARVPALRADIANDVALLRRLDELAGLEYGLVWIMDCLKRRSGKLIVLLPASAIGFSLRYENLANCFHLFSLLQIALSPLIPGCPKPDSKLANAARGVQMTEVSDSASWHFGNPLSNTPELVGSIWGEATLDSIPFVDGTQVMLLWPPLLKSRSWDSGFFCPQLEAFPPDVLVERPLDVVECQAWFTRLTLDFKPVPATTIDVSGARAWLLGLLAWLRGK